MAFRSCRRPALSQSTTRACTTFALFLLTGVRILIRAFVNGTEIREGVEVRHVVTAGGRVTGVETNQGFIASDNVIVAAGLWSRSLLRSVGVAARFVSGYLYDEAALDNNNGVLLGGGETHAWCEVYLPGAGWGAYDATNALVAGRNLIPVAFARDPVQVSPLSGGFEGLTGDFLGMEVSVTITRVLPDDEPDTPAPVSGAAPPLVSAPISAPFVS